MAWTVGSGNEFRLRKAMVEHSEEHHYLLENRREREERRRTERYNDEGSNIHSK